MCGRYYRRSDKQRIAEAFHIGNLDEVFFETAPSYNIAPTTTQPIVRLNRDTGERELVPMRWGLIPSWCTDPKELGVSTINAKAESLMDRPIWRGPFERRRCLVPADGFYEWQKQDAKTRQAYAFALKSGEPLAFAGLWERWRAPDKLVVDTYAIITTEANELAAPVHDRMPVILRPRDYARWLERGNPEQPPIDLLRPYEADLMTSWRVDARVGSTKNDDPRLLDPVPETPPDPAQQRLF